jgi:hypothetical protein
MERRIRATAEIISTGETDEVMTGVSSWRVIQGG